MNDGEAAIVTAARSGDRAAFEDLVRRTTRLVYARLYLECGSVGRAEDLVQETYLRAMKSLKTLKDDATFRGWLLIIARNVLLDDARKSERQKRLPAAAAETAYQKLSDPEPPAAAEREETRQRVLAALRSLPEEYQLPLTLRYFTGADSEAIAAQLGVSDGSLRGYLHRGLKLLRERLPEFEPK